MTKWIEDIPFGSTPCFSDCFNFYKKSAIGSFDLFFFLGAWLDYMNVSPQYLLSASGDSPEDGALLAFDLLFPLVLGLIT